MPKAEDSLKEVGVVRLRKVQFSESVEGMTESNVKNRVSVLRRPIP